MLYNLWGYNDFRYRWLAVGFFLNWFNCCNKTTINSILLYIIKQSSAFCVSMFFCLSCKNLCQNIYIYKNTTKLDFQLHLSFYLYLSVSVHRGDWWRVSLRTLSILAHVGPQSLPRSWTGIRHRCRRSVNNSVYSCGYRRSDTRT